MRFKEWVGEKIGYRFFGCLYNKTHDHIFDFIATKIPKEFLRKNITDLGCGDGGNTLRVKKVFKAKTIVGYDHNDYLLEKAKKKGLRVKKFDFNGGLPRGELATFTFSLHHSPDMEITIRQAIKNFDYVFLCEPMLDLYHRLFDSGTPLSKQGWISLFNKTLKRYGLYQYRNNLIMFYSKN